jgi:hypothetical protein
MTQDAARQLVILALVTTLLVSIVNTGGLPKPRLFIAGAFLFLVLGFLADFAPELAGPFAILLVVGVLLNSGEGAFGRLVRKIGA